MTDPCSIVEPDIQLQQDISRSTTRKVYQPTERLFKPPESRSQVISQAPKLFRLASSPSIESYVMSHADTTQADVLIRLRTIQQLQHLSRFRFYLPRSDDMLIEILNWICCCFVYDEGSEPVAAAVSAQQGLVTLYIATQLTDSPINGIFGEMVLRFVSTLRKVIAENISPNVSSRIFLRTIISNAHAKIERKLLLLGKTDTEPDQTSYRFGALVSTWLLYRPEGEQSSGLLTMALDKGGVASECLLQCFVSLARYSLSEALRFEERLVRISNAITTCNLLVDSTFFDDLMNYHTFRLSLKNDDRIFLLKFFRRLNHIASYKMGALKFAYFGVPFLRTVLGSSGTYDFINRKGPGGIHVEFVSALLSASISKLVTYPSAPADILPLILDFHSDDKSSSSHSRNTSASTTSSRSTDDDLRELSQLDTQLRTELLHSDLLANAWTVGEEIHTKLHPELQLIHYLEVNKLEATCHAFGTSKPVCWACESYIDNLRVRNPSEDEGVADEDQRWWFSKGRGKVYCNWMIPPFGRRETIEAVLEASQREMERMVEEVAFDSYL